MKFSKDGISFKGRIKSVKAFYIDILRFKKNRNILFFIKQVIKGLDIRNFGNEK